MRYKTTTSIQDLVRQAINTPTYRQKWDESVVINAWYKLFPYTKKQVKKIFIKKQILYIQLSSLILAHDFRANRTLLLQRIQEEIAKLGQKKSIVQQIVFL